MNNKMLVFTSILALVLGIAVFARITTVKKDFDHTVHESLKTTEGYDQKFIEMVNRLENVLASRASFGYTGGTDPMTGIKRRVVQNLPVKTKSGPAATGKSVVEEGPVDPFRLTAIIGDPNGKRNTAVVMDGERSYSVDQGDIVGGRRIVRITDEVIYMENDSLSFYYDIYGKRMQRAKVRPVLPAAVQ